MRLRDSLLLECAFFQSRISVSVLLLLEPFQLVIAQFLFVVSSVGLPQAWITLLAAFVRVPVAKDALSLYVLMMHPI